jgi:hypothetical protein
MTKHTKWCRANDFKPEEMPDDCDVCAAYIAGKRAARNKFIRRMLKMGGK